MEEAGWISAAVGAAPGVEATEVASRAPGEARRIPAISPRHRQLRPAIQTLIVLGSAALAYAATLGSLLAGLPSHAGAGTAGVALAVSLLLAAIVALRPSAAEPDIHDRYLDYILGLSLLGFSTAAMLFLPGSLSIFFWSWRLDVIALPLFIAGAVALLGGSRALWCFRLPIALLCLAWPLPYVAAGLIDTPWPAVAVVLLAIILAWRTLRRSPSLFTASELSLPVAGRAGEGGRNVGGGLLAAALVLIAAVAVALVDQGITSASRLLEADGQLRVAATGSAATVDGIALITRSEPPGFPLLAPPSTSTGVYSSHEPTLAPTGGLPTDVTLVERVRPNDPRDLSLLPSALATQQGYRLTQNRQVDLGAGIAASFEGYAAPDGRSSLLVVWWDWPVAVNGTAQRERVIVERLVSTPSAAAGAGQLVAFARDLLTNLTQASRR